MSIKSQPANTFCDNSRYLLIAGQFFGTFNVTNLSTKSFRKLKITDKLLFGDYTKLPPPIKIHLQKFPPIRDFIVYLVYHCFRLYYREPTFGQEETKRTKKSTKTCSTYSFPSWWAWLSSSSLCKILTFLASSTVLKTSYCLKVTASSVITPRRPISVYIWE